MRPVYAPDAPGGPTHWSWVCDVCHIERMWPDASDTDWSPRVRPPQDYTAAEIATAQGDWRAVLELNGAEPAPARVAGFLRIYARIIRRNERWDIPETMANAYESAATALDQYQADVVAQLADLQGDRDALQKQVDWYERDLPPNVSTALDDVLMLVKSEAGHIAYLRDTLDNLIIAARKEAETEVETLRAERDTLQQQKDGAYSERDQLVCALSKMFPSWLGYHAGGEWDEEWRHIVFIELPTGQASWHIHDSELLWFGHLHRGGSGYMWDGHTTPEKYARVRSLKPQEADLAALRSRGQALVHTLKALTEKVRACEPAIGNCIQISVIHGIPYQGPTWVDELKAAEEACAAALSAAVQEKEEL